MRYRRLTNEELESVEVEFTKFLASQGLDAAEWQKVKTTILTRLVFMMSSVRFFGIAQLLESPT